MKHIASCSFGKDSLATILLALEHGEPLDEAVYCEVMFDKSISGEVPEHRDFIYNTALPRLEQMGVPVRVLRSDKTYVDLFTGQVTRGPKKGKLRAFPICGKCYVQRDCKIRPIRQYQKTLPPDTVHYIGIARDEQERLLRLTGPQVSLLEKYHYTEEDAMQLCRKAGLLSPVYEFTNRGGCWFCPNAKKKELRHLYDHHPNLWAKMLELQALPGKVSEKFNRAETFSDIDARFRAEGTQKNTLEMAAYGPCFVCGGELPETSIPAKQPHFSPFSLRSGRLGSAAHCSVSWRRPAGSALQPDRRTGASIPTPMDGQKPAVHSRLHRRLHHGPVPL